MNFHALSLDRFHTTNGFDQMALDACIRFSLLTQLFTNNWEQKKGNSYKQRNNNKSEYC